MGSLFLTTVLNCNQVITIITRLQNVALLSPQQKKEIITELKKSVPSCPVIISKDDNKTKTGN